MLKIITQRKEHLLLPKDIRIAFTEVNPILVKDKGSHSLSFSLPFKKNHRYLNNPHRHDSRRKSTEKVDLLFSGIQRSGELKYNRLNNESYACNLNLSSFISLHGEKSLRELSLGGSQVLERKKRLVDTMDYELPMLKNTLALKDITDSAEEDSPFNEYVKVYIEAFKNQLLLMGASMEEARKRALVYFLQNGSLNLEMPYYLQSPLFDIQKYIPFISVAYVIEQIFLEHGYLVEKNVFRKDDFFKHLVFYSNHLVRDTKKNIFLKDFLPDVKIKDFINELTLLLNVHTIINENTKSVSIVHYNEIFDVRNCFDATNFVISPVSRIGEQRKDKFVFKISPCELDENQSPHIFLDEEEKKTIIGKEVDSVENLPTITWKMHFERGTRKEYVVFVKNENMYYHTVFDNETKKMKWEKYSINLKKVFYGEGKEEIVLEPKVNILFSSEAKIMGSTYWSMEKREIPFMFAFITDDYKVSNKTSKHQLSPEYIFDYCWKRRADQECNRFETFECIINYPLTVFNQLDFLGKIKINNTYFIIEEIKYSLENNLIKFGTTRLRTL